MQPADRHAPNNPVGITSEENAENRIQLQGVDPKTVTDIAWQALSYYFSPIVGPINDYVIKPLLIAPTFLWGVGYDGRHPWKQAKYYCVLREITHEIPDYIKMLKVVDDYSLQPLQIHLKRMINLLFQPDETFEDGCRTKHRAFVQSLRAALESEEYQREYVKKINGEQYARGVDSLHEVAFAVYNTCLYTYADSVISGAIRKGLEVCSADPEAAKLINLANVSLEKQRKAIEQLPQSSKAPLAIIWINNLVGVLGKGFDPHSIGNIPYVLFDLKIGEHTTRFLRTGTPTIGKADPDIEGSQAVLAPEFRAFLRTGRKILYFNLQSLTQGAEKDRSATLIREFEKEGMEHCFFSLDHDSGYYTQTGKWESLTDAKEFKKSIINQLFNNPSYHCPDAAQKDEQFVRGIQELIEQIHTDVFYGEERLDQEERRDFLDIFYSLFIFLCKMYYSPDTIIVACKDALDRAGKTNFLLLHLMMIYTNDMSDETRHKRMVATFAPPFLVKKKQILWERFERLQKCFERLNQSKAASNLYKRAQSTGLDQAIKIIVHPNDCQKFNMDTGHFEP